ncbi:hypothetical protein ACFVFI_34500 [Streptomyces sp. NPDC057705]|uniref:hypothetical protein n=1 Tax=Streptomyces sp. NPDC057705 TaxID=3346222 RepID=UPI00368B2E90
MKQRSKEATATITGAPCAASANDQGTPALLRAVNAKSDRAMADMDPVERLPPTTACHCAYATGWVEPGLGRGPALATPR